MENRNTEKSMLKGLVSVIIAICIIVGGTYLYQNQKIITSKGVMYNKEKLLMHDILVGEKPFGEENTFFKFGNGYCTEVSRVEVTKVKDQLLSGAKILDAVDARANVFEGEHVMWYINKNYMTEINDSDFTTRYFSSEKICKDYMMRKDVYMDSYKEIKVAQEKKLKLAY